MPVVGEAGASQRSAWVGNAPPLNLRGTERDRSSLCCGLKLILYAGKRRMLPVLRRGRCRRRGAPAARLAHGQRQLADVLAAAQEYATRDNPATSATMTPKASPKDCIGAAGTQAWRRARYFGLPAVRHHHGPSYGRLSQNRLARPSSNKGISLKNQKRAELLRQWLVPEPARQRIQVPVGTQG